MICLHVLLNTLGLFVVVITTSIGFFQPMEPSDFADESFRDASVSATDNRRLAKKPVKEESKNSNLGNSVLQKCRDSGEAYSASYLIHRDHLLHQNTDYNLTWVNCEMGSFIMMNGRADPKKDVNGSLVQSIDVLDLSVIHLSAYERLQRRWDKSIGKNKMKTGNIDPIIESITMLRTRAVQYKQLQFPPSTGASSSIDLIPEYNRTVVIMPFLWNDMGAGHSIISNRLHYLRACFWSFYHFFDHVVVAVKLPGDATFVKEKAGLPFYDILLLDNLPKSASLPVATVMRTKELIRSKQWDFDYVFFTESDQILMFRIPEATYSYLNIHPRHVVVPHRLMPYPLPVITEFHKRPKPRQHEPLDWLDMRCCLPIQNCQDWKTWTHVRNRTVPIINVYTMYVPLGNANFHAELYRYCSLHEFSDVNNETYCYTK